jgi:hypothetical protein
MCSITVKLSEYVSGLKSIFGQQWHFKNGKGFWRNELSKTPVPVRQK